MRTLLRPYGYRLCVISTSITTNQAAIAALFRVISIAPARAALRGAMEGEDIGV